MKRITLFIAAISFLISCRHTTSNKLHKPLADTLNVNVQYFIPELSGRLDEISGMIYFNELIWGINDSGGKNEIYGFNKKGKIVRTIEIEDAKNEDWESMDQDKRFIFVGDFGNNRGNREDLCIYRIDKKDLKNKKNQKVKSKNIKFRYGPQQSYSIFEHHTEYDCEALASFKDSLYLFSKDWKNLTTTVYGLPKADGEYVLQPIDTFNVNGLITGADFSPDRQKLALLGYTLDRAFVWLFTNFPGNRFFEGDRTLMELTNIGGAQTEGISFMNNNTLLISCEKNRPFAQQVFVLHLNPAQHETPTH